MKKYLMSLAIILASLNPLMSTSSQAVSLWANDDEEYNMRGASSPPPSQGNIVSPLNRRQNQGALNTPIQNTNIIPNYTTSNNNDNYNYDIIDYDTIQSERNIRTSEVSNSVDKWQYALKNVSWENYRGNNVRVELLKNNRDLKEMRLKLVQSSNMVSDPDGSNAHMLNKVAEEVMKKVCGKRAKQSIILYERPSIELIKETAYDDYMIIAKGTSLKEYGFRCIY